MIRYAKETDRKALYHLICELEETKLDQEAFFRIFADQLSDERYLCLVYERDHAVIGVCNVRMENQLHHCARIAEIMELSVSSSLRSQGIGKQLLDHAYTLVKQQGCMQMEVSSNQKRIHAHHFYEREGFDKHHFKFTRALV